MGGNRCYADAPSANIIVKLLILLRRIDAVLYLSWLRRELEPYCSDTGRPSIDPELMIRNVTFTPARIGISQKRHQKCLLLLSMHTLCPARYWPVIAPPSQSAGYRDALALESACHYSLVWINEPCRQAKA
jgi:hypothetical protein